MQDKEVRFGIANRAIWAVTTTDASNGSVNAGHDAFTPVGGAVPLVNIFFGEVIWGGVGSVSTACSSTSSSPSSWPD